MSLYNQIILKLLILLNKKRAGLTHADYFRIGIFSLSAGTDKLLTDIVKMQTDNLSILFEFTKNDLSHFSDYDYNILLKEDKSLNNLISLSIVPLNYFFNPKEYKIDNSLKVTLLTFNNVININSLFPEEIIYFVNNENWIYTLDKCKILLSKET